MGYEFLVKSYPNTLARLRVIDDPFLDTIAIFPEDNPLNRKLDAIRRPEFDALVGFTRSAMLVIDRRYDAFRRFNQVHLGDHSKALAGKSDGAGMDDIP